MLISSFNFAPLLTALGADPIGSQPGVSEDVILTAGVGDYGRALPRRANAHMLMNIQPSTLAAQFSTWEMTPHAGCWIKRFYNAGPSNVIWSIQPPNLNFLATDADPAVVLSPPIGSNLGIGIADAGEFTPGHVTYAGGPVLFDRFNVGRFGGQLTPGVFMPVITGRDAFLDLWVAPGFSFYASALSAATVMSLHVELEFPAGVG